jgi:hypothetical protein
MGVFSAAQELLHSKIITVSRNTRKNRGKLPQCLNSCFGGERRAWFIGTSRGKIKKMSKFTVFGQII